jgi:hypothetical protein
MLVVPYAPLWPPLTSTLDGSNDYHVIRDCRRCWPSLFGQSLGVYSGLQVPVLLSVSEVRSSCNHLACSDSRVCVRLVFSPRAVRLADV